MLIEKEIFGRLSHKNVFLYTLTNRNRIQVTVTNFGATVTSIVTPDRNGNMTNIVLGYDQLVGYIHDPFYMGSMVGRFANRIAKGRFTLDGKNYQLATNIGENHLHGGIQGFNKVLWGTDVNEDGEGAISFTYKSQDGEEGYPGTLKTSVTYVLREDNSFSMVTHAVTNKPTILNIVNHSYFNLAGEGDILDHELMINADRFIPTDAESIPTGEIRPVDSSPMDFRKPISIGSRINLEDEQLKFGSGYDHNWVLNNSGREKPALAARVKDTLSGRVLEVYTTQPGLQFYSGNFLESQGNTNTRQTFHERSGFCLETQHFPDAINHSQFPCVILRPDQDYKHETIFKFLVE